MPLLQVFQNFKVSAVHGGESVFLPHPQRSQGFGAHGFVLIRIPALILIQLCDLEKVS